jgi:hypothetical protein
VLDKRLADFPTLNMTPEQALAAFPDRGTIQRIVDGKQPMPTDPMLTAMYEVQIAKLERRLLRASQGPWTPAMRRRRRTRGSTSARNLSPSR